MTANLQACREKCSADATCLGYEHRSHTCEIWVCAANTVKADGHAVCVMKTASTTFVKMITGSCSAGTSFIESKSTCLAAALDLGLTVAHNKAGDNTHSANPYGCYYKQSTKQLYWGTAGNKKDDDKDRVSLCVRGNTVSPTSAPTRTYAQSCDQSRFFGGVVEASEPTYCFKQSQFRGASLQTNGRRCTGEACMVMDGVGSARECHDYVKQAGCSRSFNWVRHVPGTTSCWGTRAAYKPDSTKVAADHVSGAVQTNFCGAAPGSGKKYLSCAPPMFETRARVCVLSKPVPGACCFSQ